MAVLKPSLAVSAVVALLVAIPGGAAAASLESAVKASYLYKFTPFVEWPQAALPARGAFAICVIGSDAFGRDVEDAVRGQQLGGTAIVVRRAAAFTSDLSCQILFVGGGPQLIVPTLQRVGRQPVLTVTDAGPGSEGAMIRFVRQSGKVRFEIDATAAAASGIVISSKLLSLAVAVRQARQ